MRLARAKTATGIHYGAIEDGRFVPIVGSPFGQVTFAGTDMALERVELLAPVEPRRVLVIIRGFLADGEHRRPEGLEPRLFPKVVTEHLGPDATIPRPAVLTGRVEMEAELALVVGRRASGLTVDEAWDAIFGFTPYNDVTAAEFLPDDLYRAKSLDGFGVVGPWVSTDLTGEALCDGLRIDGRVNGEVQQSGNTARFKFNPGEVLSYASRYVTLLPGDVISLGTPPPAAEISTGDRVEVEVETIGVLVNRAA